MFRKEIIAPPVFKPTFQFLLFEVILLGFFFGGNNFWYQLYIIKWKIFIIVLEDLVLLAVPQLSSDDCTKYLLVKKTYINLIGNPKLWLKFYVVTNFISINCNCSSLYPSYTQCVSSLWMGCKTNPIYKRNMKPDLDNQWYGNMLPQLMFGTLL